MSQRITPKNPWRKIRPEAFLMYIILILSMATHALALDGSIARQSQSRGLRTVIQVVADPCTMPLNFKTVKALILSDSVAGTKPDDIDRLITIESLSTVDQSPILISLDVHLPSGSKMTATEYFNTSMEGLRTNLSTIHQAHMNRLSNSLANAVQVRTTADKKLIEAIGMSQPKGTNKIQYDPADQQVYNQLQSTVDLSSLRPDMTFSEAIELIRHCVTPPLNIAVMWKDLQYNAEVEPSAHIDIDYSKSVRLEAVLEALLLSMQAGLHDISYLVHQGQIMIGTTETLPRPLETRIHPIPAIVRASRRTRTFLSAIEETIEPDSWFELSDLGEGMITGISGTHFAVLQSRSVHIAIQTLIEQMQQDLTVSMPDEAEQASLAEQLKLLYSHTDMLSGSDSLLEMRGNDPNATGGWLDWEVNLSESDRLPETEGIDPNAARGYDAPSAVHEQVLARIYGARRGHIYAEIARLERLMGPSQLDPDVSGIRWAAKQIEQANARIAALEKQIADRVAPMVVVIRDDN